MTIDIASDAPPVPDLSRPLVHFAPHRNWMNDPNGTIYHEGVYHLFYQYNPDGNDWGNMSWGHATSGDLLEWTEHPVALSYDESAQIFSGSIVFDSDNTSGFGTDGHGPLVALYTAASPGGQAQALAWSNDEGGTWIKHGIVLDRGTTDFRDPKVMRYRDHWLMVAVEARDHQLHLFRSDDLIHWTRLSVFGPLGPTSGLWECPDLFQIGDDWVMTLSVNPGHPAGGSGMAYFVGHFDGETFVARHWDWLDDGPDYYAGVTFGGLDGPVMIAWMNNWAYAHDLPDTAWRGSMALPRRLSLQDDRLVQLPAAVPPVRAGHSVHGVPLTPEGWDLPTEWLFTATRLLVRIDPATGPATIRLSSGEDRHALPTLTLTVTEGSLALKRTSHLATVPEDRFTVVAHSKLPESPAGTVELDIWIDANSVEVFAAGGAVTLSMLTLADYGGQRLTIGGTAGSTLEQLTATSLSTPAGGERTHL